MSLPDVSYSRRPTRSVRVGDIYIGSNHPVVVQSMITEETHNVPSAVEQIIAMHKAGSEIVRVTTPNITEARCLAEIKSLLKQKYQDVPLVADVHHQGSDIAVEVAKYVDKIRINPGLFVFRKRVERTLDYSLAEVEEEQAAIEQELLPVIEACKARDLAMRIGVNHGSLAERLTVMYGDTPEGMVQSAIEYIQICERHDYRNIVISLKASRVQVMLQANRLMAQRMAELGMDYPLHLGVTEAGSGQYARIKSTAGIGTLLAEGIGDTIRVSLSEDPVKELPACYDILQALGIRRTKVESDLLPLLRAHQIRSAHCGCVGRVRRQASVGQPHRRRHGLYRKWSWRNGGCGLRVCGQGGRQNLAVSGPSGSENGHSPGEEHRGTYQPYQIRWQVGRPVPRLAGSRTTAGVA